MKQLYKFIVIAFLTTIYTFEVKASELTENSFAKQQYAGGIGDFIKKVVNGVLDIGRPVWGSYTVSGQNNSAPIALFKRTTFENDKKDIINRIKENNSDSWKIYQRIFQNATQNDTYEIPAATGEAQKYETRATFAKNAAFVLVLGVNQSGDTLRQGQKDTLAANILTVIRTADDPMDNDWFKKSTAINEGWGEETQMIRSMELVNYCTALDLLRTAGYGWNNDRGHEDNPRKALKYITRKLYRFANRPFNTFSNLLNNNITLIVGSAVLISGIINCDETDYFFKPYRQPDNWARKGHVRIRQTEFTGVLHSQSELGKKKGHHEGPGYYAKAMKEGVIPMAIAFDNFVGNNANYSKTVFSTSLMPTWQILSLFDFADIKNYIHDPDWKNTFEWYKEIIQPNGAVPSYDDTKINTSLPSLACTKDPKLSLLQGTNLMNSFSDVYDDRADFLAANNPCEPYDRTVDFVNLASKEAVFRTPITTDANEQHYLHVNFNGPARYLEEKKAEIVEEKMDGADHSHPSAANIIINAGNEILLMDAPYYGYSNKNNVNKGHMHNVVTINGQGPIRTDKPEVLEYSIPEKSIKISTLYELGDYGRNITREIQVHEFIDQEDNVRYYYEVNDKCGGDFTNPASMLIPKPTFTFNLNGNGSLIENGDIALSTCNDSRKALGEVVWSYPCFARETWKLYARTSISSPWPAEITFNVSDEFKHGNDNFTELISFNSEPNSKIATGSTTSSGSGQGQGTFGTHATFKASVTAEKVTFQTILIPLKCDEPDFPSDSFWVRTQNDSFYSVSTLKDLGSDHVSNIHIKKGHSFKDTIQVENALFNSDLSQLSHVKLIGDKGLLSVSRDSVFKRKNCIAYTKFRRASFHLGKLLMMNDTVYITSSKTSNVDYKIIGPAKYVCNYKTDTACTINLFLAGMERGKSMKVEGYTHTYDTGTCMMSIDLPVGQNQFEIELTDPCLVSCFFPSTQETIHETFNFNEGITATLGHKLDIVQPHGFLNISKGSHMKICNGVYLRNRDSLVLYSGCGKDTGQLSISTCDGRSNGNPSAAMEGVGGGAKASMITVMDGAALILDDSSFTQISNNSELHVWGTLVIKAGAKLLIGDGRKCSYASIMVYPGAYVHIEDEAHLEFFKIVGDTQDRHIFFVSKLPTAASAIKGVAPSIVNLLLTDTILTGSETPVELCDLYTVTPDHGIANREWGFSNILKPKADILVPNDTICQGECLLIDFSASLNDPIRSLEVCRIDTLFGLASEVCFGSMRIEGMQLTQGYNESSECYYSEASLKMFPLCNYIDSGNAWYKIFVKVENHCGIEDTQSVYFFVAKKPSALLALADTLACSGYGTVKAYNWSLVNAEKATYHVHVIDTTQYQDGDENRFFYGADWELFNLHYGDSFEFPDFKWQGGFKYAVSLTQYGWCGEYNTSWDTVNIQPGAVILASTAGVYSNPLGPSALQLQGFVGNADYYTWSPTTDLDNPYILNPIATPSDTVTYVLSAFKGSCEAHDTLFVKHNSLAFAGLADTICAGESVILGTSFDASLFLGYQFYENHLVLEEINERLGIDINFFSKLSVYLLSDEGKTALNKCVNYSTFLSTLNREQFYQEPWYAAYLEAFSNTYDFEAAFNLFVSSVNNNGTLSSYIGSNSLYDPTCFVDFLNQYDHDIYQTSTVSMNATWEKYEDTIITVLTHYTDQIKATDTLSRPSSYKITVIDNNVGKVEYDHVNIWVQQNIQPQFFVQFQIDSTLYFSNQSEPIDYSTQYLWDFGDGQTSTQLNPIHTFPFFDSSYIVCLSATNLCGTFSVCDTIRVDSSGLIAYSYSKQAEDKPHELGSAQIKREITVQSFPNPIKNEISFVYDIPQAYENGEIILMNYVGQTIQKSNIKNAKGLVKMNLDGHSSGMYLYQIIIDAHVVKTGKLVKE